METVENKLQLFYYFKMPQKLKVYSKSFIENESFFKVTSK